ncbi:MAG: SpoIID/LytB domain-containing protein [Bacteroidales bacterium]
MTGKRTPEISVGIVSGSGLTVTLNGRYGTPDEAKLYSGRFTALAADGGLNLRGDSETIEGGKEINLIPENYDSCSFTLHAVTIGVNFHWQRNEDQTFRGTLRFIVRGGLVTAVNLLPVEDYLVSVISSEMSATSSGELLRAHAVISRSWLLAQIDKTLNLSTATEKYRTSFVTGAEITRWYDREDHKDFDVCADDHCQRYQGITRASTREVEEAVRDTIGEVLMSGDSICDARYSKCCGGMTELFENVWEPVSHPYLVKHTDAARPTEGYDTDLTREENAVRWISGYPEAFCNTNDKTVLSQVLNNYDQETNDFFRWKVSWPQGDLSELVREKTGIDFGLITALEPLSRGTSGRIIRLKITGEKKTLIIGKELEIRKALSKSHLYSSAFFVETVTAEEGMTFILHGAGWGHGVGLCQIGAAVMGASGYGYRDILSHYFVNTGIIKMY